MGRGGLELGPGEPGEIFGIANPCSGCGSDIFMEGMSLLLIPRVMFCGGPIISLEVSDLLIFAWIETHERDPGIEWGPWRCSLHHDGAVLKPTIKIYFVETPT